MYSRYWVVFSLLSLLILTTGFVQSWSFALGLVAMGLISGVMALGLNIQWGYAGQFNAGVMGFAAIGATACVLVSMPWVTDTMVQGLEQLSVDPAVNAESIHKLEQDIVRRTNAEHMLWKAWLIGGFGAILAWFANRLLRNRVSVYVRTFLVFLILIGSLALFSAKLDTAVKVIEATGIGDDSKYLGGLGLPIIIAWVFGGILAAGTAWLIARIALGLRSDYLAIATLGISEIVIAILKNEGWLTRGVLNVTGLPSPVPSVSVLQSEPYNLNVVHSLLANKLAFIFVVATFLAFFMWIAHRALYSPWGRMMRAIRDNEEAANAMGKDITRRHRQVFILGSFMIGCGGAMLATHVLQFEPAGYHPLRYTFLIWVMVIAGGSGNNWGAVVGGLLIWFLWVQAEPAAAWFFAVVGANFASESGMFAALLSERAPQMRTLVMGTLLLLVLRFAPRGLLPAVTPRK
tara:strand:- start:2484 stop:3866 length:1383 start_codon:yes stop_codon:yes gene_type:complete